MGRREYKKRRVLQGFPWEGKFETKEEVDAYLCGDKIQCLLCGKWFIRLAGAHLIQRHNLTSDDYKERYGIPWGRGLIGESLREEKSIRSKKLLAKKKIGPLLKGWVDRDKRKKGQRRPPACIMNDLTKWRKEDYEAILERMMTEQRTLCDVCGDPDLPGSCLFSVYAKKHAELKEKVRRIYYTFPYSMQFKVRIVSPNFQKDCRRLRASGMMIKSIAKSLGASLAKVSRVARAFDEEMGVEKPRDWKRKDFEAILDRIRAQRRSLSDVCGDPDLPNINPWRKYIKKYPEFAAKLQEVYHSLPYSFQSRVKNFSPRFKVDCEDLRAKGMTMESIAKKLEVSSDLVSRALLGFDEKRGIVGEALRKWGREDYEAILKRIAEQRRSLKDVCGDPDLPSKSTWTKYVRRRPEFAAKLQEVYYSLPYSFQSRVNNFSPSFKVDCEDLRAGGMSLKKIAKTLGVSVLPVRNVLRGLDEKLGVAKPPEWGQKDFEAILDRIRYQRRTLYDVCRDPDLPNIKRWVKYVKKHPEFAARLQDVYHGLPYFIQARVRNFSPRFRDDCERMRDEGMTIKKIAKTLGVSVLPVRNVLRGYFD